MLSMQFFLNQGCLYLFLARSFSLSVGTCLITKYYLILFFYFIQHAFLFRIEIIFITTATSVGKVGAPVENGNVGPAGKNGIASK